MDSTILKKMQSLTTAEDMREQTKLMIQPHANWEAYLSPAPQSIAILGELVRISSETDFSINKTPPIGGYKYVKHSSFCACLMQVCNAGWWAFNEAHRSMDQIRLHTAQVPDYMKTAVRILFQDNDEVIEQFLPGQLKNLKNIADECVQLSINAENGFSDVINIIHELLEACTGAKHAYGEEEKEMQKLLEETRTKLNSAETLKKETEKLASVLEQQVEQAQKNYQKEIAARPTGWELVGMTVVEGLVKTFSSVANGLTHRIAICNTTQISGSEKETADYSDELIALSKSGEILSFAQEIKSLCEIGKMKKKINWKNIYDEKTQYAKTNDQKSSFQRIKNNLEDIPKCPAKTQCLKICNLGIDVCEQLALFAPKKECNAEKTTELIEKVLKLDKSALDFDCRSKSLSNFPGLNPKPPMMSKQQNVSSDMTAAQLAVLNAQTAVEQTQAQMNEAQRRYDKCYESQQKNQKEMTDFLITIRNCDLKKIDFETTKNMLTKGMKEMGKVKVQWEKMIRFFQMVSTLVKITLEKNLTDFVSAAEKTQIVSYSAKLFAKDLLYTQAFQASNIASLVHMISATYTDISSKYLMDRVSLLGQLMTLESSDPKFKEEMKNLRDGCDEATEKIKQLVLRNKDEFEKNIKRRQQKIETELLAILPAVPLEEIKSIQESVQSGFTEEEEAAFM